MATVVMPLEPVGRALRATVPLAFVSGFVDVVGFIALFGLFASHITGNFTVIGSELVHPSSGLIAKLLALPTFVVFVMFTRFVVLHYDKHSRSPLRTLLIIQAALLVACMLVGQDVAPVTDANTPGAILTGLLGVAAMAIQNGYARLTFAAHPSTTIMTTNAAQAVIDLVDMYRPDPNVRGPARERFTRTAPLILGFVVGTIVGAYGFVYLSFWCLGIPIVALLMLIAIAPMKQAGAH